MAAPVDAGSIYADVRIRLDRLNGDIKSVKTSLDKVTKASKETAKESQRGLGKFFSFIKTSGVGSFLALSAVIAGTTKFLKDSEEAASDAMEIYSKFNTVFSSIKESANKTADSFAKSFGLAGSTARELLGTTGDLLVGLGATEEQGLTLSKKVNTLAADLASFSNIEGGASRASEALTAALLGEREQAKSLGIIIRESDVQTRLAEQGKKNLTGQSLLLARAEVTLQLATEQSQKAIGDYARTSESAANVSKRLKEQTKGLKEAIGKGMLPTVTAIKNKLGEWAKAITEVINKNNELRGAEKALAAGNASRKQTILLLEHQIELGKNILKQTIDGGMLSKSSMSLYVKLANERIGALQIQIGVQKRLQESEKEYNDAKIANDKKAEAIALRKHAVAVAQEEALKELTKRQFDALTPQQQRIQLIDKEIDKLAVQRTEAKKLGVEWKNIQDLINNLYAEKAELQKESINNTKKETTEIVASGKDYLSVITKEAEDIKSLDEVRKSVDKGHFDRIKAKLLNDLNANKITMDAYTKGIELVDQAEKESAAKQKQLVKDKEATVRKYEDLILNSTSTLTNALSDLYKADADNKIAEINRKLQAELDSIDQTIAKEKEADAVKISSLEELSTEEQALKDYQRAEEIAKLKASNKEEDKLKLAALYAEENRIKKLTEAKKAAAKKEEKLEAEKANATKEAKQKIAQIEYEANLASWKMKKLGLISSGAEAAISSYVSAGGFPLGILAAAAMAGVTAVELATLDKQKPKAPQFATGGIVLPSSGGSLINVAENGSPELMLNNGASGQALLGDFADQIVQKMGGGNMSFQLVLPSGDVIAEAVAPAFNDGRVELRV